MSQYQPTTGERCGCRPGIQRDNCPQCEGTGLRVDFKAIRARRVVPVVPVAFAGVVAYPVRVKTKG